MNFTVYTGICTIVIKRNFSGRNMFLVISRGALYWLGWMSAIILHYMLYVLIPDVLSRQLRYSLKVRHSDSRVVVVNNVKYVHEKISFSDAIQPSPIIIDVKYLFKWFFYLNFDILK